MGAPEEEDCLEDQTLNFGLSPVKKSALAQSAGSNATMKRSQASTLASQIIKEECDEEDEDSPDEDDGGLL